MAMKSRSCTLIRNVRSLQKITTASISTAEWKQQQLAHKKEFNPVASNPVTAAPVQEPIDMHYPDVGSSPFVELCKESNVQQKIGFIGGGNMGKAMIKGFLNSNMLPAESVGVSDPFQAALEPLKELGVFTSTTNDPVLSGFGGGVLFLATKPHILPSVLSQSQALLQSCGVIVSICAGTTLASLEKQISGNVPIVRVMPNTPALIGCGASVFARNKYCTDKHCDLVKSLMETVGTCSEVPEYQVDAVCGLSGCGPAYVYTMIDALSDGGVKMGLPRDLATHLAAQTLMGAAKMVLDTGKHPGELKNMVCSPGGTTIAGVHALEEGGVRPALMSAVEAGVKRAKELGSD